MSMFNKNHEKPKMTIGERLKQTIADHGYRSPKNFAEINDLHSTTVYSWVNDQNAPGACQLILLKRFLPEMSLDWLLTGHE